jgi:hypothetical protein
MTSSLLKTLIAISAAVFVFAATPSEVAPIVDTQGYFIEEGSGATDESISRSVSDARASGGALSVVVLAAEPAGGATTYSGAVLTELAVSTGTVLTVALETIGAESLNDIWSVEQIDVALDLALNGETEDEIVSLFVKGLIDPPTSGGGGGWIFLLLIVAAVGGIALLIWRSKRAANKRAAQALDEAKAGVQSQIDAIANDIIDLEDEIDEAGPSAGSDYFHTAAASFTSAGDRLAAATDAATVLDLSFDLDMTIWQLDCAEAHLDGNELPEKPVEPMSPLEPAKAAVPTGRSADEEALPDRLPEYHRRGERKSSYGSNEMMQTLLVMQAMTGLGSGGGHTSGRRGRSRSGSGSSGSRIRSGRRRRG